MSKTIEKKKKPVLPIYLAGLVWLICGILLPLYRPLPFLLTAALSVGAYVGGNILCPSRVVKVEVPFHTGVGDVDTMLTDIQKNLDALNALNRQIPDPDLSGAITRMEKAGREILSEVENHPDKAKTVRRFADYYLPECVNVLSTYAELETKGVTGENASRIRADIHKNAQLIALAFENQLDALYSAKSMSISADLTVLDGLLKGNGLL